MIESLLFLLVGCTSGSLPSTYSATTSLTTAASPTPSPSSTIMAVKIIFQNNTSSGSFPTSPNGTAPGAGNGLQAETLFAPDGSTVIATGGPSGSNWPNWIASIELGVSGSANTAATNADCARFAGNGEASAATCNFAGVRAACGAPSGWYRVSEADCNLGSGSPTAGSGSDSDGIYVRVTLNRGSAYLARNENILAVLEYSATALNPASQNPTSCFGASGLNPETCADFVWRAYLKTASSASVSSFFLLIPPTFSSVLSASGTSAIQTSGTTLATRQFILPLSSDQSLTVLQISRTTSLLGNASNSANLTSYCTLSGAFPANSPLCAGIILYGLTLYRI